MNIVHDLKIKGIIEFLIKAKKATYAGDGNTTNSSRPCSHDLKYFEDNFEYYDSYFGTDPFIGEEALWSNGEIIWSMNYAGRKLDKEFEYGFLKEALLLVNSENPFRGPDEYSNGDYNYMCETIGDFEWFQGYESITFQGKLVYECYYHGGIVR